MIFAHPRHLPIAHIKVILIYIPVRSAGGGLTDYQNAKFLPSLILSASVILRTHEF
jgi:hypothetical protein